MHSKKIIKAIIILAIIFGVGYFSFIMSVDKKILKEVSGTYTGIDIRKDGTKVPKEEDDDSEYEDYNSCYSLLINSERIPYLDVYDSEAANPGTAGIIIGLDDGTITLWLNPFETDFGFSPLDGNSYMPIFKVRYEITQDGITLSHGKREIPFRKD